MRGPLLLIALVAGLSAPASLAQSPDANQLTAEERASGWELLFDGKTTKGWRSPGSERFPDGYWVVEDGLLRGAAVGNRATDLMTTGVYRDFELRFDWKIAPGGNSGVKYLVGSSQKLVFDVGKPPSLEGTITPGPDAMFMEVTSGLEYQLLDDERHPDGKKSTTRSGSLYELAGFDRNVVRPAGQWNQSRILLNRNHLEHWLNGTQVISVDLTSVAFQEAAANAPPRTRRALQYLDKERSIALQTHTGAIWFRGIKLHRLPATPAP
ncbi:MAG: DUF1080 domain-containing protein [Bryobacteraceae bacterium]